MGDLFSSFLHLHSFPPGGCEIQMKTTVTTTKKKDPKNPPQVLKVCTLARCKFVLFCGYAFCSF